MNQYYGEGYRVRTGTSMNTAHWRIYDPDYVRGRQIGPTSSIPTSVWVLLVTILVWGLVMGGKYLSRCHK